MKTVDLEKIYESWPDTEFIKVTGYDNCVLGVVSRMTLQPVLLYDREKLLQETCKKQDWTYDEAVEWHEFNTFGAWYGDGTPCFLELPNE